MLMSKGFEVELYTGTPSGEVVGFAKDIAADLPNFVCEPDNRNVEYTTPPLVNYGHLLNALIEPRQQLRKYLRSFGDYTILPGSTLSLGDTDQFYRSTPNNAYHTYIEQAYGTNIVTASVHINIGIPDTDALFKACRLIRMEAPLYLAMSASSPFLNGKVTGWHSTRWHLFPQTPINVPLFVDHQHFIDWTHEQLANRAMHNIRHLWCSVRPNGTARPCKLNRLELRICDLMIDPVVLLAVTALLELRILLMLQTPEGAKLDPLMPGASIFTPDELSAITAYNEAAAAFDSLNARMIHWQTGEVVFARDWIYSLYEQVQSLAVDYQVREWLMPISHVLNNRNEAQNWLQSYGDGNSPQSILAHAVQHAELQEIALMNTVMAA